MDDLLVKLQIYEGPLDLLLHLIKKNEVDMDDIPVAIITEQYLGYLDFMESLNIELAADFLVMAATLTQLKSRLLLPREDDLEDADDIDDNLKTSLIDPLMEHLKQVTSYQDAALALGQRQMLGSDVFSRGGQILDEIEDLEINTDSLLSASLMDLAEAFRRLKEKKVEKATLRFVVETKTLAQRLEEIRSFLKEKMRSTFEEICAGDLDQKDLVLSFLSILELARIGFLNLYQNLSKSQNLLIFLANPDAEIRELDNY